MFISQAFANGAEVAQGTPLMTTIIPFALVFIIFYFLVIRPQNNRVKAHKEKIESVKRGDDIVTGGGIVGKIAHVREELIEVDVAPNVRIKVQKGSISDVINKEEKISKS